MENSERIAKILIDSKNSSTVYVAVLGHLWDAYPERGVYKTTDNGATWQRILYVNDSTGAADIALDPQDSQIIYAAMWQFRRKPYFFTSGGPGSGFYKSTDAGKTWSKITKGLPKGNLGRIAIAVAPSNPYVVYAVIESEESGLYRSDDKGETWIKLNSSFNIIARPFYFSHLIVDPQEYKRVYKPGYNLSVSNDGGISFASPSFDEKGIHPDHHVLWINPNNPASLLLGTDGGVYASSDRGGTWRFLANLPISQFYHVSFDMEMPYNVYGGLQDNGSWMAPSESPGGIENRDWHVVGGGDGFYVHPDPKDNDIVYCEYQGGNLLRFHKATGETKEIKPFPGANEPEYRYNWNTPLVFSPTNPQKMYVGSQFLLFSTDRGESWERISPDLTTNDPEKLKQEESGGITIDNTTAENHCTIYTISESPKDETVIWAGTDDGNVQVTHDGGKTWLNVTKNITGLPSATWCSSIEASHFDTATAYAVFDGHRTGDRKVYVYKTTDYGKSWKSITTDQVKGYALVIREDIVDASLLFLGTEFGLFMTVDGGEQWAQFTGELPNVPVRDIAIHPRESDLILATHGRGIYIIDDISFLRQITPELLDKEVHIFEARPSTITIPGYKQDFPGDAEFVGSNPPEVATITYYLKKRHVFGDMKVEIYDTEGKLMTTLPGSKRRGINRVKWQMRMKPPKVAPSPQLEGRALFGPMVPEGIYSVKLLKGQETYSGSIRVIPDPKYPHSTDERILQQETVMKLYSMQEQLALLADTVTDARDKALARITLLKKKDKFGKTLQDFADKLTELHKTLVATKKGAAITGEEKLREKVVELYSAISSYGGKPTQSQLKRMEILENEIQKADVSFQEIINKELDAINKKLQGKKLDIITLKNAEPAGNE
ncbi:MAG: hypothetical protein A2Y62_15975 [Candidatus Fischerbacteria bacterium RBG_13_37_8]|uniref:Glycosyl hydrolase n=1 Tax=Candidatus Fischerbacteria bacterium RBG_13_37_8 TaxID=1817863 RepID=A0A1F5VVF7_9BACT|nr:MAG: hypothetical protein A2Y62_15975 [Candidatus Fischerbacteria bacterium RBG_13_37_8]